MKRLRLILLGVSIIAIMAMALVLGKGYFSSGNSANQPIIQLVPAVKITADLKRGDKIDPSKYTVVQVRPEELSKNIIQTAEKMNNHFAATDLYAGEYAYISRITDVEPHGGKQRVAVDLTPLGAAAGKLERGQTVTIRVKKGADGTAVVNPQTGAITTSSAIQTVDIITPSAEVAAVVDSNLQDHDGFTQVANAKVTQAQPIGGQPIPAANTSYFIPKYALVWVTPQEADLITKYDTDGGLRLAIN